MLSDPGQQRLLVRNLRIPIRVPDHQGGTMRILPTLMFTIFLAGGIAGCNTTRGIGQDVEAAGEGIEEVAEQTEEELED